LSNVCSLMLLLVVFAAVTSEPKAVSHQDPSQAERYSTVIAVIVAPGDTLSGIAAANGASLAAVESANPSITNPNYIYAGETVLVPQGGSATGWQPAPEAPSAPVQQTYTPAASPASTSYTPAPVASGGGALDDVPGVPSSFAACVAYRESTDGQASSNVYGILDGPNGADYGASLAQQKQDFATLYAEEGTQPWAPSDGC
jgi:LysM repeat protein